MNTSKHFICGLLLLSLLVAIVCGDSSVFQLVKPDSTHTNIEIVPEGLSRLNNISQKVFYNQIL